MLSLARKNAAGRCIHCAIRSQRLSLQSRQFGASASHARERGHAGGNDFDASKIRFTSGSGKNGKGKDHTADFKRQHKPQRGRERGGGKKSEKDFLETLQERLKAAREDLKDAPIVEHYLRERREAGDNRQDFNRLWMQFTQRLATNAKKQDTAFFGDESSGNDKHEAIVEDLRQAFNTRGQRGLDARIRYAFYGRVTGARFTESDIKNQKGLADLRYPTEWYPGTRIMHRTIHLHVGPTNSGKTYHALQRLEQADRGVYAGPLRLLAHEVYTRMTAKGRRCALVTGEERRIPDSEDETLNTDNMLTSCTVEMVPTAQSLDVAVIDEIQMIGNAERGWAWTQALLGVRAKEVHLCGEERTVPLIKELCASVGEKLVIHNYKRLSPLKMADDSLNGKLADLRKGDCIVSFSVIGIHALRKQIERATGRKVATVYGSLPPETRAQQARLFNDPDNDYDFLVASDAVGMGLNLAIKRVIFEASNKFDGAARRTLPIADIKQIAGRAGRYRTAAQATDKTGESGAGASKGSDSSKVDTSDTMGIVTTLEKFDFPVVKAAMASEPEPIRSAGIYPPATVLERFSSYFPPGTPFSYIITRLQEMSMMHKRFHLCGLRDQVWIADLIEPVQGLTIADRNQICSAPASQTDADLWRELMPAYARIIAEQTGGDLVDIPQLPLEVLESEPNPTREYLRELERLHKGIVTYLWLSYRFAGIFNTRALAFHVKTMVEEKIEEVLSQFSFTETQRRQIAAKREKELRKHIGNVTLDENGKPVTDADTGEDVRVADTEVHDYSNIADLAARAGEHAQDADGPQEDALHEQTTLTSGGDRFGGDEEYGFEDPEELEQLDAEREAEQSSEPGQAEAASSSFSAWRTQQTKGESQGSTEAEDGIMQAAHEAGEEAGHESTKDATLESLAESEPTVADVQPDIVAAEKASHASDKATSSEQDPLDIDQPVTPDTELPSDQPPVVTQEVSPAASANENQESGLAASKK